MHKITRRRFLQGSTGLLAMHTVPVLATLRSLTTRQSAGPFYPEELPLDDDNDLTHVAGQEQKALGQITDLDGRILDQNGRPLGDLRIEIWQCDFNGRYRHPRDSGDHPVDPAFQGIGHTISDQLGRYRFRTIRPVPYPGRTPHIHVAVFPPGDEPFTSQLYVAGDPRNASDFLYQRVPEAYRHLVTTEFKQSGAANIDFTATWDIVMAVTPG
jgi:protocatechuate 3,4-dioxygenase beta subunit